MNIRKAVDYSTMFATLESVMKADLPQMELYCEIGKAVCAHSEKGAAVAAAEFIKEQYPDMTGFSPRNVRRMRDFWQLYSGMPELLGEALRLNWTQNVVIMEAELTSVQRISCLQRAAAERLSKKKLLEIILNDAFAEKPIDEPDEICYNITNTSEDGADQAQFESPLRCVAKRKRGVVRCGRRKISSLVSYCCSLASGFLSTAYCFPYLQAWLGSS